MMQMVFLFLAVFASASSMADEVKFSMMKTNMQISYLPHENVALTAGNIVSDETSFAGVLVGEWRPLLSTIGPVPYLSIFFGPVYADEKSPHITGELEFVINVELGLLDVDGFSLGLNYFHMSNANLKSPNDGLDKLLIAFGVTF